MAFCVDHSGCFELGVFGKGLRNGAFSGVCQPDVPENLCF
jgi:hypothetical protein